MIDTLQNPNHESADRVIPIDAFGRFGRDGTGKQGCERTHDAIGAVPTVQIVK